MSGTARRRRPESDLPTNSERLEEDDFCFCGAIPYERSLGTHLYSIKARSQPFLCPVYLPLLLPGPRRASAATLALIHLNPCSFSLTMLLDMVMRRGLMGSLST